MSNGLDGLGGNKKKNSLKNHPILELRATKFSQKLSIYIHALQTIFNNILVNIIAPYITISTWQQHLLIQNQIGIKFG